MAADGRDAASAQFKLHAVRFRIGRSVSLETYQLKKARRNQGATPHVPTASAELTMKNKKCFCQPGPHVPGPNA